jgi:DNA polymerase III alpha subunit (gram-positive type)
MQADDRIVFFDLETGGLEPGKHPVIQFAGIAVDGAWEELEALELKLQFNPASADPEALAVNHYASEAWSEALSPAPAAITIAAFFRRHASLRKTSKVGRPYTVARVAAHNARFDCDHLGAFFKARGEFCPAALYEPLDTLALARWVSLRSESQPKDHKLGSLCEWLGVPLDAAHDALADVRATVEVARLLSGRIGVWP